MLHDEISIFIVGRIHYIQYNFTLYWATLFNNILEVAGPLMDLLTLYCEIIITHLFFTLENSEYARRQKIPLAVTEVNSWPKKLRQIRSDLGR